MKWVLITPDTLIHPRSISWATGMICSSTNCRTAFKISDWSSERPSVWQRRGMWWLLGARGWIARSLVIDHSPWAGPRAETVVTPRAGMACVRDSVHASNPCDRTSPRSLPRPAPRSVRGRRTRHRQRPVVGELPLRDDDRDPQRDPPRHAGGARRLRHRARRGPQVQERGPARDERRPHHHGPLDAARRVDDGGWRLPARPAVVADGVHRTDR